MSESINWNDDAQTAQLSTNLNKLCFYKSDGSIQDNKAGSGDTHPLEYVSAEVVDPKTLPPKIVEGLKGKTPVSFTFIDLTDKEEKTLLQRAPGRFVLAFKDAKPKPGDKIVIKRIGDGNNTFGVNYVVLKLDAPVVPVAAPTAPQQ